MVSALSEYCTLSIVLKGKDQVTHRQGKLAGSYKPGDVVYESATDTWTQTPGTATYNNIQPGYVEFDMRTSSTFGEVDIDTAYTDGTARNVTIITGPFGPDVVLAVKCKDLSADKQWGTPLSMASSGALDLFQTLGSDSKVAIVVDDYTNGDTVVKIHPISG